MTLPCTLRLTHANAKIGFVFSQRGVIAEACSSFFLPRLIGTSRALKLAITGEVRPAGDRAFDGLFSEVLDRAEEVLPRALEVAGLLAEKTSSVSTFMIREMFYRGPGSAEEAHLLESRVMGHMRGSAVSDVLLSLTFMACMLMERLQDNDEAVNAFLQKRSAKFTASMATDAPPVYPWFTPVNTKNPAVADPRTNAKPKL
jgi:enoyl-CoA hydratase/carnithine racemase